MKVLLRMKEPHISLVLANQKTQLYVKSKSEHKGTVSILNCGIDYDICEEYNINPKQFKKNVGKIVAVMKLGTQRKTTYIEYSNSITKHFQIDNFINKDVFKYNIIKIKRIPEINYIKLYGEPKRFDNVFLKSSLNFEEAVMGRNIISEFKSPISSVLKDNTSDLCLYCHWHLAINPYLGCNHDCSYCLVKVSYGYNGMWTTDAVPADFNVIQQHFDDGMNTVKDNLISNLIRKKMPVKVGISTDPFQPVEKKYKITLKTMDLLQGYDYPYILITKGILAQRPEYLDILSKSNVLYQQTIITLDEELTKILEPNAPSPQKRIDTLQKVGEAGVVTHVRIEPWMLGVNSNLDGSIDKEYYDEFFKTLSDVGVSHIMLRHYSRNPMTDRVLYDKIGIDYKKLYVDSYERIYGKIESKESPLVPEPMLYIRFAKQIKELTDKYGMTLAPRGCLDLSLYSNKTTCCSVDELTTENQNKFFKSMNKTNPIWMYREAKEKGSFFVNQALKDNVIRPTSPDLFNKKFKEGWYTELMLQARAITDKDDNVIGFTYDENIKEKYLDYIMQVRKEKLLNKSKKKGI